MGLLSRLRAATPENPSFNLNDPRAWDALMDGPPATSGVRVSHETALTYSPWWRGINLIAGTVGKLPVHVYRRVGETGKVRAREHKAYYLIRRKPNAWQTAGQFKRQLTGHAVSKGNGYGYIYRNGDGSPREIVPLNPDSTFPVRENGRLLYVTQFAFQGQPETRKLLPEDVLHIKGFGGDGLSGYHVLDKAREHLGLGMGARKYATVYFKNSGRPAVVLETPQGLENKKAVAIRESWERLYTGLDNAHRTAVLTHGLSAKVIAFNAKEAQLLDTLQFALIDIANILGLPPHKLGHPSRTAFASLEQENQAALDEGYDPWLHTWEEELWDKLLTEDEKHEDTHFIEFLREALVRADLAARSAYYRTATAGRPWMLPDEVRDRENMNPVGGSWAEPMDPLNFGQGGANNEERPPAPPKKKPAPEPAEDLDEDEEEDSRAAARSGTHAREILAEAARRVVRRIRHAAAKATKQPGEFLSWIDGLLGEHMAACIAILNPAAGLCGLASDRSAGWLLAALRDEMLTVSGECKPAELAARVDGRLQALEQTLPATLAEQIGE